MPDGEVLRRKLRLIVLTDRAMATPRSLSEVVTAALEGGAMAIQLRDKTASAAELLAEARRLRRLTRRYEALLFVNDRVDVALAAGADGVHLGPDDIPVAAVRSVVPGDFLVGYSTDTPEEARRAQAEGASYLGCGTVFPTTTKADAGNVIGIAGLATVVDAVGIPVVGIGGVDADGARSIAAETGAAGVAVVGAVMRAERPKEATEALLRPWSD